MPRAAAERELHEETGITREQIAITSELRFLVDMPEEEIKIHSYLASLIVDAQAVLDPFEYTDYRWQTQHSVFASNDLLPCVPSMIAATLSPGLMIHDLTIMEGVSLRQF